MKTLDQVLEKKKEAEKIESLTKEIRQLEIDIEKIEITCTIEHTRITVVNHEQQRRFIDIKISPIALKKIISDQIRYKKETLDKLLIEF